MKAAAAASMHLSMSTPPLLSLAAAILLRACNNDKQAMQRTRWSRCTIILDGCGLSGRGGDGVAQPGKSREAVKEMIHF